MSRKKKIAVISDVDGCLTDGRYVYTADGKVAKVFGPHDNDGVKMLRKEGIDVEFISADKRGFPITHKRISDMKCNVTNVSEDERVEWIRKYKHDNDIDYLLFFGDGIADANVKIQYACDGMIAPANAREEAKKVAEYVTPHCGGDGAFLDLALYVLSHYND